MARKRKKFFTLLEKGLPLTRAAGASGLGRSSVFRALQKGRRAKKRCPERDFWDLVQESQDRGVEHLYGIVEKGAKHTPALALRLLRAMHPSEFMPEVMVRVMNLEEPPPRSGRQAPKVSVRRETWRAE